jgi:hypothetical protein
MRYEMVVDLKECISYDYAAKTKVYFTGDQGVL